MVLSPASAPCAAGHALGYQAALALLLAASAPVAPRMLPLAQALGSRLAADCLAPGDLPIFDNAAMDGFALAAVAGLAAGSEHAVLGRVAAGDPPPSSSPAGAWEIMTGAVMPAGTDTVVPVEFCSVLARDARGIPTRVRLDQGVAPGRHVRAAGSDVAAGQLALPAGTRVDPAALMLLAALGVHQAPVRRPKVAVLATGNELADDATQPLAHGRIHGSNLPYLAAALSTAGAEVVLAQTVPDQAGAFAEALVQASSADLVISTGAVSMGHFDFVPSALHAAGAQVLFQRVAIRPGKPLLAARLPTGPLLLGLPGNPMAVAVGLRFFVAPLLALLAGSSPAPALSARLAADAVGKAGLRCFLRARLWLDRDGLLQAEPVSGQEAYRIQPFARANGWIVLGEDQARAESGTRVEVASLDIDGRFHFQPQD